MCFEGFRVNRRHVLGGLFGGVLGAAFAPRLLKAETAPPRKVVSLDYGIATTLLALGVVPAGVAAADRWDRWVVEPELPPGVVDLGKDQEVNLELLAALGPDLILATPYVSRLRPLLERIAPVVTVAIYAEDGRPLERARAGTRSLGRHLGRTAEAEAYLRDTERFFEACADRVAALNAPPLAFVNFMDARHARVFGRKSLYQDVLDRIGLENAWTGPTNYWGFQTIGIEELATASTPEMRLIAFEPVPPDVRPTLAHSPLWNRLPFVEAGRVSTLPGVLMFGMVPSAVRFASLLVDHLEDLSA